MLHNGAIKNEECIRQWYLNNRDRILKDAKQLYCNNTAFKKKEFKEYKDSLGN